MSLKLLYMDFLLCSSLFVRNSFSYVVYAGGLSFS